MAITVTWYGHAACGVEVAGTRLLIDPFLRDNPMATLKPEDAEADFILVSHGHSDHVGDAVAIAKRTGATVVANAEMSEW
ncbi:MAG: MBL fold metallo-hydrolase, partial [Anaerolineales bacterium]